MKPGAATQALIAHIDADTMLRQVLEWAAINTGNANIEGLDRMAGVRADAFSTLPGNVELVDPATVTAISSEGHEFEKPHGRHMVLRGRPEAERRFVLTGHMDTVFPVDHPFQETTWLDDDTINGPGTADMKGGLNVILHALMTFETIEGSERVGYDVMINSDEETGSLASRGLIEELARGKYAALTYEPSALPDGTLAHARGGTGNYSITFTGKSAHAGRNPHDGRNAIVAASDLVLRIKALEAEASLRFNIRPKSTDAMARFDGELASILRLIETEHQVGIHRHGGVTRPPKPVDEKAQRLFDLVKACGAELGQQIGWKSTGGVCDGSNIAATGVPVVDTMGVRGGAIHSPDEFMIVPSLRERAALSALVLAKLSTGDHL